MGGGGGGGVGGGGTMELKWNEKKNELIFDKSTNFKQVCQLLLSLIVALWGKLSPRYLSHFALMTPY